MGRTEAAAVQSDDVGAVALHASADLRWIDAGCADAYRIEAALPGWKPEQIDISIENGILSLKGEITDADAPAAGTKVHVAEIRRTSFLRRFALPAEVEADQATASFENGVLTLEIPKAEVVKPKQIRIEVK
jgi:HSP20 family protein